jgi:hypothetical protein
MAGMGCESGSSTMQVRRELGGAVADGSRRWLRASAFLQTISFSWIGGAAHFSMPGRAN